MKVPERLVSQFLEKIDSTNEQKFIFELCENILTHFGAEHCLLFETDTQTEDLYAFCSVSKNGQEFSKETRVPNGKGIAGRVARLLKPLIIAEGDSDPYYIEEAKFINPNYTAINETASKSILAVPLIAFGSFSGVIEIIGNGHRKFSQSDIEFIQPLCNMIAIGLHRENKQALIQLAELCVRFLEERDYYTHGHSLRVTEYSIIIAEELNLTESQKHDIRLCAILHDIGKVTLKDSLLSKSANLTKLELQSIRMHPIIGYNIVSNINKPLARVILSHHEHYDGMGYPQCLKGEEIPLLARIIGLVDTFDAMTTDRPYREAIDTDIVVKEISNGSGTQFDPGVVEAFLSAYRNGRINLPK